MSLKRTRILVEFPLAYDPAHWPDTDELTCTIATYFECVLLDDAHELRSAHYEIGRDPTVWMSTQDYLADIADRWSRRRVK